MLYKDTKRIGKQEMALLEEINAGDVVFGFLTSGGSTTIAYRQAKRRAYRRKEDCRKQDILRRLKRLEEKNLICIEQVSSKERRAQLTEEGQVQLSKQKLIEQYASYHKSYKWDGVWRIVMFDIPQEQRRYRYALRHLLQECGFVQVQQSVYVAPYPCRVLKEYIANNRIIGSYVHIVKGEYVGDDMRLRKEFGI
ncbi:MAG: CRISPR-associated endonuclease Cas2 [Patescibacteria group bacterium]